MAQVVDYVRSDGSRPFRKWFDGLDVQAAAKVSVAVVRLETGTTSNVKWMSGVSEYRIDWGPGYRLYFVQDGAALIVLLAGGTKRSQQNDILRARALAAEYKRRKADAQPKRKR